MRYTVIILILILIEYRLNWSYKRSVNIIAAPLILKVSKKKGCIFLDKNNYDGDCHIIERPRTVTGNVKDKWKDVSVIQMAEYFLPDYGSIRVYDADGEIALVLENS